MPAAPAIDFSQLVRPAEVHRDVYTSKAVFEAEQERLFAAAWNFVAHGSQLPKPGNYVTLDLAGRPLLVMREADGGIGVFYNRCAHKGSKLYVKPCGDAGRVLRCPYHAWTYRLDGSLLSMPLRQEYDAPTLTACAAGQGLSRVGAVAVYRDFIFVRLNPHGIDFDAYFGDALRWIDNMADRSPTGRLVASGGVIRSTMRCNWKMYLENINDTVHPVSTHESAGKSAKAEWGERATSLAETPKSLAVEQLLPFASGYDFFTGMDAEVYPHGHSAVGARVSTHTSYAYPPEYEAALVAAHGEEKAHQTLSLAPQNSVFYPSIAIKGAPLVMRVIRPLAADLTLIEAWSFRAEDAPELLLERAVTYNRLVFSPMSVVAHDDVHLFEGMQKGLQAGGNPWVSLHRGHRPDDPPIKGAVTCAGTSELLMRNQFQAWAEFMATPQEP